MHLSIFINHPNWHDPSHFCSCLPKFDLRHLQSSYRYPIYQQRRHYHHASLAHQYDFLAISFVSSLISGFVVQLDSVRKYLQGSALCVTSYIKSRRLEASALDSGVQIHHSISLTNRSLTAILTRSKSSPVARQHVIARTLFFELDSKTTCQSFPFCQSSTAPFAPEGQHLPI